MTDTEVAAETELREWATARKITAKTVDLLVKDGFSSMHAVELLDKDNLAQSKITRGTQKLLLKAYTWNSIAQGLMYELIYKSTRNGYWDIS